MSMSRKIKKNICKKLGIKFIPEHLSIEEIKYVKGLKYNPLKTQLSHKDGEMDFKFISKLYIPSNYSKEVWAIIYNLKPEQLNNTYDKNGISTFCNSNNSNVMICSNDMLERLAA